MELFSQPPVRNYIPAVISQDVPVYRVKAGKFFCDDEYIEEGQIIEYEDEPNIEMEPLNKLAAERFEQFLDKIDRYGKEVAAKNGKAFISRKDAFKNAYEFAKQEGKKVRVVSEPKQVPILGGKKKTGKRKVNKLEPRPAGNSSIKSLGKTKELDVMPKGDDLIVERK
jgi:hypothetical protein